MYRQHPSTLQQFCKVRYRGWSAIVADRPKSQRKPKKQMCMIERAQHDAPASARILAYTSLCRPHVEYPPSVWGSSLDYLINDIEMVQHNAIRFIPALKGRDSVTAAHVKTRYPSRQTNENNTCSVTSSFVLLTMKLNDKPAKVAVTRAVFRGNPPTIYAKKSVYYNSFLPKQSWCQSDNL